MRHIVTLIAALAAVVMTAACAPDVPDEPTWTEDVRPILVGNCVRCHTQPVSEVDLPPEVDGVLPDNVRFDKYDDEDRNGDGRRDMFGAGSQAAVIAERVDEDRAADVNAQAMPPDFPLFGRQQDVITAWADAGAPLGPPRQGNRLPTMEMISDVDEQGDNLVFDYRIDDPDFELVIGRLIADPQGDGAVVPVTYDLYSGVGTITWNVADVPSAVYQLTAELQDGDPGTVRIPVGTITVD